MFSKLPNSVKITWPVSPWTLTVSAIVGVSSVVLHLHQGTDFASTMGVIDSVSVALGIWVSANLYLGLTRLYRVWNGTLRRRIATLKAGVAEMFPEPEHEAAPVPESKIDVVLFLVKHSFFVTMVSIGLTIPSTIRACLLTQIEYHEFQSAVVIASVGFGVFLVSVLVQSFYILYLQREVSVMEKFMSRRRATGREEKANEVSTTVIWSTTMFDDGIRQAWQVGRRFSDLTFEPVVKA